MDTLISIIVPIYKVPEIFLKNCIESLINQTFKNIEILLIDDGSPDNCGKICDEYAKKDTRIKVIHQNNKGLCGARNTGLKEANGNWIFFVDGDDWLENDAIEILYNASSTDIDIVCCEVVKDYGIKKINYKYEGLYENNKIYQNNEELKYMQKMLLNFNGNNAWAVAKLINRNIIFEYNIYYDETLKQGAEALEFNIRLFKKAKKIKFIQNVLYHYTYNNNSITTTHSEKNHYKVIECFEKIKSEININDEDIKYWFYNRIHYVIVTTAISGYFSPTNNENYYIKKKKFLQYLKNNLIVETLNSNASKDIDFKRKIVILLIKLKLFRILSLVAILRKKQKEQ